VGCFFVVGVFFVSFFFFFLFCFLFFSFFLFYSFFLFFVFFFFSDRAEASYKRFSDTLLHVASDVLQLVFFSSNREGSHNLSYTTFFRADYVSFLPLPSPDAAFFAGAGPPWQCIK